MKLSHVIKDLQDILDSHGDLGCFDASGSEIKTIELEFDDDDKSFVGIYS